ncbi:hypothetical protein IFM89_014864 [Coptis chinensis]|uniref:EF-hand domain-containing protein n=1 Tax=Coptis chinensis TaxID=261450 RepID=A0A835M4X4_9MAGN|nr:hypothetical protein IFM89_014864 [Coptis chinensis]
MKIYLKSHYNSKTMHAIFLHSITPTARLDTPGEDGLISRSVSATSRLRRMFSWRKSSSARPSADITEDPTISAGDIRRMIARLELLNGLNFVVGPGMVDSKEFALEIFDALARRRRQKIDRITKEELYDFWLQISDQSFDARLQLFFDMADSNEDGRITREEVQEVTILHFGKY